MEGRPGCFRPVLMKTRDVQERWSLVEIFVLQFLTSIIIVSYNYLLFIVATMYDVRGSKRSKDVPKRIVNFKICIFINA